MCSQPGFQTQPARLPPTPNFGKGTKLSLICLEKKVPMRVPNGMGTGGLLEDERLKRFERVCGRAARGRPLGFHGHAGGGSSQDCTTPFALSTSVPQIYRNHLGVALRSVVNRHRVHPHEYCRRTHIYLRRANMRISTKIRS